MFRALLEVEMLKKCMPLRREAHFQVKILKANHVVPFLETDMSKNVARNKFGGQKC